MKKIYLLAIAALPGILLAQEKESSKEVERIIITKKEIKMKSSIL